MVRAGTGVDTIKMGGSLASSLGGTARTMIEHADTGTMVDTGLGTMVINSDDEDEVEGGTMKSKTQARTHTHTHTHTHTGPWRGQ